MKKIALTIAIFFCWYSAECQSKQKAIKPRTVVTTDGEVDDIDSFIRYLLYTNDLQTEALVYSASQFHYAGDGKGTQFMSELPLTKFNGKRTELRWFGITWMQELIATYGKVYPNLKLHSKDYPTPDQLLSLIKVGNIEFEGEMAKDTEGSDYIKKLLLDNNPAPIYFQIWGGTNTVARALKSIEDQYKNTPQWTEINKKVSDKAVIYIILDQDLTYKKYVAPNWPNVRVYYNREQFQCLAYSWPKTVPEKQRAFLNGDFMGPKIILNHGPLFPHYYTWGDGQKVAVDEYHTQGSPERQQRAKRMKYDFISEGDSPSYFHLIDVGLGSLNDPSLGGWGGRLVHSKENPRRWEDGRHVSDFNPYSDTLDIYYPQARWIDALQRDFAARADWCVLPYKQANHAPQVNVDSDTDITVKPGSVIKLSGSAKDPDGNTLTYKWWQYVEAGSYPGKVTLQNAEKTNASFTVPADAKPGDTIHIIFEVTDAGVPALTRYRRVMVKVN